MTEVAQSFEFDGEGSYLRERLVTYSDELIKAGVVWRATKALGRDLSGGYFYVSQMSAVKKEANLIPRNEGSYFGRVLFLCRAPDLESLGRENTDNSRLYLITGVEKISNSRETKPCVSPVGWAEKSDVVLMANIMDSLCSDRQLPNLSIEGYYINHKGVQQIPDPAVFIEHLE